MDKDKRRMIASVLIVLAISLLADMVTGGIAIASSPLVTLAVSGCNNPASILQCGKGTCQFGAQTPNNCVGTVIFSKPFATPPKNASAQLIGWTFPDGSSAALTSIIPSGTIYIESDNGTTWHNMPKVQTELYGNQNHETTLPVLAASLVQFFATCILGSSNATAILRPMYSDGQGGTVHQLAATPGALDIHVDDNNSCLGFLGIGPAIVSSPFAAIAAGFLGNDPVFVVGLNGAGAGDNPIFNEIGLNMENTQAVTPIFCIPLKTICPNTNSLATATQMKVEIDINVVEGQLTMTSPPLVTFDWYAWQ